MVTNAQNCHALKILGMSWGVKKTLFEATGVSLGGCIDLPLLMTCIHVLFRLLWPSFFHDFSCHQGHRVTGFSSLGLTSLPPVTPVELKNCSSNTGLVTCENAGAQRCLKRAQKNRVVIACGSHTFSFSEKDTSKNKRNIKSIQTRETKGKLELKCMEKLRQVGNSLRRLFFGWFLLGDPFQRLLS